MNTRFTACNSKGGAVLRLKAEVCGSSASLENKLENKA
jgi:hypothetical protein